MGTDHMGPAGHGLVSRGRALNRGWSSLALCSLCTPLAWSAVVTAEGPEWKSRDSRVGGFCESPGML